MLQHITQLLCDTPPLPNKNKHPTVLQYSRYKNMKSIAVEARRQGRTERFFFLANQGRRERAATLTATVKIFAEL